MTKHTWVGTLAAFLLLAAGGIAYADGEGFGSPEVLKGKVGEILGVVLTIVFGIFIVVGCGVIIMTLVDSKKYGFGHFAVGLVVVLVAGIALFTITSLAGQDGNDHLRSLNENRKSGRGN